MTYHRAPNPAGRAADAATGAEPGVAVDEVTSSLFDAAAGLDKAAELIDDDSLASVLAEMAERRRVDRGRILAAAVDTKMRPDEGSPGTVPGALRRGWMRLEAAIAGDGAVVETITDAEGDLLEDIDRALGHDLPKGVADEMRRAREAIVNARSMLEDWKPE